jgi:LemA protein
VQSAPGSELANLNALLLTSDATLAFARKQFNAAVAEYNHAVKQFPTLLLVGLFGFRTAGTL